GVPHQSGCPFRYVVYSHTGSPPVHHAPQRSSALPGFFLPDLSPECSVSRRKKSLHRPRQTEHLSLYPALRSPTTPPLLFFVLPPAPRAQSESDGIRVLQADTHRTVRQDHFLLLPAGVSSQTLPCTPETHTMFLFLRIHP